MQTNDRLVENWDGRDYERYSPHQRAWGGSQMAELSLRGDERVLDLGCGDGNIPNLTECLTRQMATPPFSGVFAGFRWPWFFPSIPEYDNLLGASPFAEWRAWIVNRDQRFPSAEAIVGWIDNPCLIPFVQRLPADLRKPFRDGVVEAMLARTCQSDGSDLEPFRRINVWAWKSG